MKKKPFLMICALLASLHFPASAQVPTHVPGWPHISDGHDWANYTLPLMASEGNQQYLFYATVAEGLDKYFMDGSFAPGWPLVMDSLIFTPPFILADIDHDGKYEMVIDGGRRENGHYTYSLIFIIDDDGSIMQGWPVRVRHESFLNVADMDCDNEYEILYFSSDENIINCLDRYGNPKPGWPTTFPIPGTPNISLSGAIGDLDLDGFNEYIIRADSCIFAYRFDGTMQPGFPIVSPNPDYYYWNSNYPPALGDLDMDGYPEIIAMGINSNMSLYFVAIYNHLGNLKPNWPKYWYNQVVQNPPVPSDINGDGIPEIGIEYDDTMTFVDVNGNTLPGFPATPEGPKHGLNDFMTVDVDGDGYCEIFTDDNRIFADSINGDSEYFGYGYLYGTDHLGQNIPGYPIILRGNTFPHPPVFAQDLTTDRMYMALATDMIPGQDTIRDDLWQFPDPTGPATQWPMQNHDILQTRNYNFVDQVTSIEDNEPILPKNIILKQNYPNPFNGNTIIEFTLPKEENVNLSVYDILGRKVKEVINSKLNAGNYKENINLNNVASGVYFCVLQGEKTKITRKMMLVK